MILPIVELIEWLIARQGGIELINLGKLKEIKDLRKVWPHEAIDFTPWLAEEDNLALLADAVGLEITVDETESSVGDFNVDIYATETGTDRKIIIENQLEDTNHDHLGKLITYASGKSADIVIWVVKRAREEHRSAIEWLNNHTDENIAFFLVEIKLYQIGSSDIAVKFEVVEKPNDWTKEIKRNTSNSPKCGDIYRRIAWNNRGKHSIVWRCCTRVEHGPGACAADTIQESELQNLVVRAINMALCKKDTMSENLQKNVEAVLTGADGIPLDEIDSRLEQLQKELLKVANAKGNYDSIADEIYHLREVKQNALVDNAEREGVKQRISEMQQFLAEQTQNITEYDEQLVRRLIEKITVYEEKVTVEFKSGTSVDVRR